MTRNAKLLHARLVSLADPRIAAVNRGYFKQREGEAEEPFLGIRMPALRKLIREYRHLSLGDVLSLLKSSEHEARVLAVLLMVDRFERADVPDQKMIYEAYLENADYINNWDMVDLSTPQIIGGYLQDKSRMPLYRLAKSRNIWERRMAILATFTFIRNRDFADTLALSEILLQDREDLIHKAVGWMLREAGKRNRETLVGFLTKHHKVMPRTMLRYAIEKFSPPERKRWMA